MQTIQPTTNLPTITAPVFIDGYSQPGASVNTNPITMADNAVLLIELDGALDSSNTNFQPTGLNIAAGGSTLRGLVINDFNTAGVQLTTSGEDQLAGDFIGTDPTGTTAKPNGSFGLQVSSSNNTIGGTNAADCNVISGNGASGAGYGSEGYGIFLEIPGSFPANTLVEGNFIGTDATGTQGLGYQVQGISVDGPDTTIGGTTPAARNVISGNLAYGIEARNAGALIQGNLIGTDLTGTQAVPNGFGIATANASGTTIGGTTAGAGNIISGNKGYGIDLSYSSGNLIQGNIIGSDATGTIDLGNGGEGIDVGGVRCQHPDNQQHDWRVNRRRWQHRRVHEVHSWRRRDRCSLE